ncbi:carbohydrate ABC transporter permease [Mesorhizobium sp. BR1-1-16]|uniref:carbohydrate ABC transporter permease n=1 Tax=Mesorhizobium sp. BR1-1-16 TaxID=2876653 RepID=UPI001CCFB199|nr:carbohydrate ABC transporter permease [Mesorhizobium sp. BR1-1-16]MBZ9937195.1 carbohydrate ABC transporter permease [Mesorhizobium sp. BR1-1-16]
MADHEWKSGRARVPLPFTIVSYVVLAFFTVFTLFPLIWLGYTSFKPEQEIVANMVALPVNWTVRNYVQAWQLGEFGHLFVNSLIFCVVTTVVVVLLSLSAAFAFTKIPSRWTRLWFSFIGLGLLVTISSSIVPLFIAANYLGLTNTYLGILIPYVAFNISFAVYLAASFVRSIPNEVIEAAKIDGANYLQVYRLIVLPMSRPIITTIAIFTFHACWVEYVLVYMMSSDSSIRTVQVGLSLLKGQLSFNFGFLFAAVVIASLPLLILYLAFRKHLQTGFSLGALKG